MDADNLIPWRSFDDLEAAALRFLRQAHPSMGIPIPIETIVEQAGIDIVPIPGLRDAALEIDGFASLADRTIYVDAYIADRYERRYRFTLAHELSHLILHAECAAEIRKRLGSLEAYRQFLLTLSKSDTARFEAQAYHCAGILLVPPQLFEGHIDSVVPELKGCAHLARESGGPWNGIVDEAWLSLQDRLSALFNVSQDVIARRLERIKFTSETLEERLR